jgi:hypothetical protein
VAATGVRRPSLLLLDVATVVGFAAIGRSSHAEGLNVSRVAGTAAPFLAGTVAGWLLTRAWRQPGSLSTGAVVWGATVAGGLALRAVAGNPPPLTFAVVATVSLGVGLTGWRLLVRLPRRPG